MNQYISEVTTVIATTHQTYISKKVTLVIATTGQTYISNKVTTSIATTLNEPVH